MFTWATNVSKYTFDKCNVVPKHMYGMSFSEQKAKPANTFSVFVFVSVFVSFYFYIIIQKLKSCLQCVMNTIMSFAIRKTPNQPPTHSL